jgi:hypothetical protein
MTNTDTRFNIIDEHDMNICHEVEIVDTEDAIDISNDHVNISYDTLNDSDGSELVCIYNEGKKRHKREKRENNENSLENIEIKILEIELLITTATTEEVIFKKHNVEIIDKKTKDVIMEGVVSGYKLMERSYNPDILLVFNDGRTFYNDNFEYMFRFYI